MFIENGRGGWLLWRKRLRQTQTKNHRKKPVARRQARVGGFPVVWKSGRKEKGIGPREG